MKIYTVVQQKGGTGKTTLAADLVAALVHEGQRVLAIDCDSQRNFGQRLGLISAQNPPQTVLAYTAGVATAAELAVPSPAVPGADVIRGNVSVQELPPEETTQLRDLLPAETAWDACVIDTPGALGYITLAACAAADVIAIPVETKGEALDGVDETNDFIVGKVANLRRGRRPQRVWYVPTRMGRNNLGSEVVEQLRERFPGQVTAPIRESVRVADAYNSLLPGSVFSPRSNGSRDLQVVCKTLITGKE